MQPVSPPTTVAFVLIVAAVAAGLVAIARSSARALGASSSEVRRTTLGTAALLLVLLGGTWAVASSGALLVFDTMPPRLLPFVGSVLVLAIGLASSRFGKALAMGTPLSWLVGLQMFRLPLELVLHQLYREDVIPVQMTFEGRNLDILTGLGALLLSAASRRGQVPRVLVLAWNVAGLGLLANIVGIAILSVPGPLRVFMNEPANTLPARAPFVWLATLLVPTALSLHLLVFRKLVADREPSVAAGAWVPTR